MTEPVIASTTATAAGAGRIVDRRQPRWRVPLIAAVIITLAFLAWQLLDTRSELRALRTEVAQRLNEGDTSNRETRIIARSGQDNAQSVQGRLSALEGRVLGTEGQQASLEKLYQDFSRTRDERALQEVEQAVTMAGQQLQLAGNVPGAIAALEAADARIASLDQPRLMPLRRLITRDIDRLKSLPLADVSGMSLEIESMLGRIDGLPFAFEHGPPALAASAPLASSKSAAAKPGKSAGRKSASVVAQSAPAATPAPQTGFGDRLAAVVGEFVNGFRDLVRIERLDGPQALPLAPAQVSYLRENLRLRLLSARLALLQRDGRTFAEDLRQARGLLEGHFDTRERNVASIIEELRQMESARLVVELPQLTETEAAVRRLRLR